MDSIPLSKILNFFSFHIVWIWILIFLFLITLIIFSNVMCKSLFKIIKNSNLSEIVAGIIILSIITSFPEIINTIFFSFESYNDKNKLIIIFSNIWGTNQISGIFFLILNIIFIKNLFTKKNKIDKQNYITLIFVIVIDLVCILGILTTYNFKIPFFWLGSVIILIIFFLNLFITFKKVKKKKIIINNNKNKYILKKNIIIFTIFSIGLICSSYCISLLSETIRQRYNWKYEKIGGILISLITCSPELITLYKTVKLKLLNTGIGNIIGSAIFNLLFIFLADLIYFNENIIVVFKNNINYIIFPLLTIFINLSILIMIQLKNKKLKISLLSLNFFLYIFCWIIK